MKMLKLLLAFACLAGTSGMPVNADEARQGKAPFMVEPATGRKFYARGVHHHFTKSAPARHRTHNTGSRAKTGTKKDLQ